MGHSLLFPLGLQTFLDVWINVLHQIWKTAAIYYISSNTFSVFLPNIPIIDPLVCLMISHRSLKLCLFLFVFKILSFRKDNLYYSFFKSIDSFFCYLKSYIELLIHSAFVISTDRLINSRISIWLFSNFSLHWSSLFDESLSYFYLVLYISFEVFCWLCPKDRPQKRQFPLIFSPSFSMFCNVLVFDENWTFK